MGAKSETIKAAYETHVVYQKPAFGSPDGIDQSNWKEHLGDEQCVTPSFDPSSTLIRDIVIQVLSGVCGILVEGPAGELDADGVGRLRDVARREHRAWKERGEATHAVAFPRRLLAPAHPLWVRRGVWTARPDR